MKSPRGIDPLVWFCIPVEDQQLLTPYITPGNRASLFRRVPIDLLEPSMKVMKQLVQHRYRVRYRGPRQQRWHTIKENAETFSLYLI